MKKLWPHVLYWWRALTFQPYWRYNYANSYDDSLRATTWRSRWSAYRDAPELGPLQRKSIEYDSSHRPQSGEAWV